MTCFFRISLVAAVAFVLTTPAYAQITAATVSGTAKDETGGVLPGVSVEVKNLDTGLSRTAVTDGNGNFTIPGLPPGRYETRAALQGFATVVESDIRLAVAQQAALNITMKVSAAAETINVVGAAMLVDTQSAALSAVVTEKTIGQLPLNGRNYVDLALLQPGVASFYEKDSNASSNRGTKFNVNGMGFRSNSYLLDGANMRGYAGTATVSAAETTLGVETIQEFRVVTNAYSADYGRAMGGVISLVTKSGTNELHGSAFEFFRDSAMDARNFFDRGDEPPPFTRHQFGGSFGGPLRRDRVFVFGGVERLQEDLGVTNITTVPTDAVRSGALGAINPVVRPYLDLYPRPNGRELSASIAEYTYEFNQPTRENFAQGRADVSPTDNDSLFVRYTYDGADQSIPLGFAEYGTDSVSRNQFFTTEYKRILTSALLNTVRFSHSRLRFEQLPVGPSQPNLAFVTGQDLIGVLTVPGYTNLGGGATNPSTNNSFYWTFSNDVSYSRGRQLLKAGALIEHLRTNKLTATNVRGTYTFPSLTGFLAAAPNRFVGVAPEAELERVRPNTLFGFYVQDDFRATSRLTLNLGLRYEFYTLPHEADGLDTALLDIVNDRTFTEGALFAKNPSLGNVAPRLGVAWDVAGDGRMAVRGGIGAYHDTDGPFNSAFGIAAFSPPFAATATINNPTFPQVTISTASTPSARTIDYNIKQPYGITYNASVQWQLIGDVVMTAGYAGSRAYNLMSAVEANPVIPQVSADGTKFFAAGAPRRNPAFGPIDYRTNGGNSDYNSLQLVAQKRFSRRYQVQANYTLGKVTDNLQAQLNADVTNSSVYPQDPYDREIDRARADFDVRHVFSTNFVWELPGADQHPLAGGWQLNGILTLRSGVPFTPALGNTNWSRSGNTSGEDRPNLKPGTDPNSLILGGPDRYFDTSGFLLQPQGFFGDAGRNSLTGPGLAMMNVALVKNTGLGMLGSAGALQLRLEVFNLFNRANFAVPNRVVFAASRADETPLPTAGRITRTITSARQFQFGVKVLF
jgi:Carboxypeptidase regulatory-like domain/TonB-dependent Receptor Plug Domain/TonB dependent receptor-like, beta-barrel